MVTPCRVSAPTALKPVAVGVTLAASGWYAGRRLGPVGAGLGIIVQAAAFLVLDGRLLAQLQGLV